MVRKLSRFKISDTPVSISRDPESLFRDIKQRSPKIQYLWSHQADILRTWHQKFKDSKDVAIELPTGTGKTLIGLLIAEFRRQTMGERVLYLCPTRQLANQVTTLAEQYGIKAPVLMGDQTKYLPASYGAYASGQAIAVTTYSGVFNTNPRLKDANCLILDDAHSCEDYIASLWTINVDRIGQRDLYMGLVDIFKGTLRDEFIQNLQGEQPPTTRRVVDKIPTPVYLQRLPQLKELLATATGDSVIYPWAMNREHMEACNMFLSWTSICIRPIIPPTLTHPPFASANHRVYMSATLGSGGELERITGVPQIARIPVPGGWDRQSTGRRFFIVPGYALDENSINNVLWQSISTVERSLILCPDRLTAKRFETSLNNSSVKREVLSANDIEDSLTAFTSRKGVVLILSGRYDGLDLEGEACRLMVVYGLPSGHNAQEEFLLGRIGATSLLRDRIRTRLTQAFGRCTRGPTDYAAIILIGAPLIDFCIQREVKSNMHPELQAELEYGLNMSATAKPDDWKELLGAFLAQSEDWRDADDWIKRFRDRAVRVGDKAAAKYLSIAPDEVGYLYSMWRGDYGEALSRSRSVSDTLTGNEVAGYRAWWYYLAGSAAWLVHQTTKEPVYFQVAKDLFTRASACQTAVSWFSALARMGILEGLVPVADDLVNWTAENVEEMLVQLGLHGPKFERAAVELIEMVDKNESGPFTQGLEQLGKLLGYTSWRPGVQGAPDCVWTVSDRLCIAFEAKSEETVDGTIPMRDARETRAHLDWVSTNVKLGVDAETIALLVSPRSIIAKDALPHAGKVYRIGLDEIRELARKAVSTARTVRAQSAEGAEDTLRKNIQGHLIATQLDPIRLMEQLKKTPLNSLQQI